MGRHMTLGLEVTSDNLRTEYTHIQTHRHTHTENTWINFIYNWIVCLLVLLFVVTQQTEKNFIKKIPIERVLGLFSSITIFVSERFIHYLHSYYLQLCLLHAYYRFSQAEYSIDCL